MTDIYKTLLQVAVLVVFVIDLSGVVDSIKGAIGRFIGRRLVRLRPIDCSLCMVWWTTLIVALCLGELTLSVACWCALLSLMSKPIGDTIMLAREFFVVIINALYKLLGR